jgi:myo-inositol-1(or 4)-monophosphatase
MQADRHVLIDAEAVCVDAVRQAGTVLRDYFRAPLQVGFKEKGQQAPVTEADLQSEALLRKVLSKALPDHGIVGEESEDVVNAEADYMWFLDPLDGTANFAAGLPAFAISMGLCFRGQPVLGVIAIPWEGPDGTIFRAHQGGGAYCNDVAMQVAPAEVPAGTQLASMPFWALWQFRVRRRSRLLQTNVRASGSIAYELAYAAAGTFQYSIISGAQLWDMVAGVVLVREAGGVTLFGNGTASHWSDWDTFLQRVLVSSFGQDAAALRKLRINILAGNARLVHEYARQVALRRPSILGKTRRRLQKVWTRFTSSSSNASPSSEPPATPSQT